MRRLLVIFVLLSLVFAALTALLLPSPATLDVSFESDVVEFQTDRALGDALVFNPTESVVCGELDPRAPTALQTSACGSRFDFGKTAQVRIPAGARAVVRRQNVHELELGFDAADPAHLIRVVSAAKESTTSGAYIHIPRSFFDGGNVVAIGSVVSMVRVGSSGRTFGQMNGLLLLNASVTPLSQSVLDHSIVRGEVVKLGMGDVIDYVALDGTSEHANLFLRVTEKGEIVGTARIPISELTIRRLGGDGVPVFISWWSRLLAEPILVAGWGAIGFFSAILAVLSSFLVPFRRRAGQDIT